jgi:hypothetical protein
LTQRKEEAAQRLISFINDECGEHLAALLLGDYGSRQRRLSQIFLLTTSGRDHGPTLRVEITTDHRWGLTCGREPLVIMALLKLLLLRSELLTGRASYSYQEVLQLLGWRDTKRSRDDIRDAVDINFIQSFNLSAEGDDTRTPLFYRRRQHMMTGYEFFDERDESDQPNDVGHHRADFQIYFDLDFIMSLRERTMLDIDWTQVTSVTRSHQFEGLSEEPK